MRVIKDVCMGFTCSHSLQVKEECMDCGQSCSVATLRDHMKVSWRSF